MFKQIKNYTVFYSLLLFFSSQADCNLSSPQFVEKISIRNKQSYPWSKKDSWSTRNYRQWLEGIIDWMINPTDHNKRRQSFQVFEKFCELHPQTTNSIIHDRTTWDDLTLFVGDSNKQKHISNHICPLNTEMGKLQVQYRIATPTDDLEELLSRQEITMLYANDDNLINNQRFSLPSSQSEQAILSFWKEHGLHRNVEQACFSMPYIKKLNTSATALLLLNGYKNFKQVATLAGNTLLSTWLFTEGLTELAGKEKIKNIGFIKSTINLIDTTKERILSYIFNTEHEDYKNWLMNKQKNAFIVLINAGKLPENKAVKTIRSMVDNNKALAISSFISGGYLALNVPNNIKDIKNQFLFDNCFQTIMFYTADYINKMYETYTIIKNNPTLYAHKDFKGLVTFFEQTVPQSKDLQKLLKLLKKNTFKKKESLFCHRGNIIRAFNLMLENKDSFIPAIQSMGFVDVYISMAKTYKESQNTSTPYCKVEYITSSKPSIEIRQFWHPLINKKHVVNNSITLGTNGHRLNIIVTGPNAGGKSTTLKGITLSLILAQSFGFAPAQFMQTTPFSLISTYLNITDDLGQGNSLFKAEVKRTEDLIKAITNLSAGQHSFAIFDEMFTGTSPAEAAAIGYSVCKSFSKIPNNICITATHFPLLTTLQETTDTFTNYRVSVNKNSDGTISYPYKIYPGVSHQNVAIDILKNQGFASKILDVAQNILKQ